MDISFNITKLDATPSQDGLTNVVKAVCWNYQTEVDGFKTILYGVTTLGDPEVHQYTEYNDLTKTQVEHWILPSIDLDRVRQKLQENLDKKMQMDVYERVIREPMISVKLPIPW